MTSYFSENAIMIEMPKVVQIVQKRVKNGQKQAILQSLPDFSKTI